ncbi:MAG: S1C family serine protease [Kofleriaceae bacterium]
MANPAPAFVALDNALAAAVKAVGPSVVHVARGHHQGGTGIVWAADLVITSNFHTPDRTRVGVATADGELDEREAEVIGRDRGTDVALLRVTGGGLSPATFRELGDVAVGNLALAIGRPGRTARASLRAIGVLGPEVETPNGGTLDRYLESDRQIPRGFAGGPLVTPDGSVLGMNTRTLIRGADLAVPTATLTPVVAALLAHGGVHKGYLGVGAYPSKHGAIVASLEDDGPAAKAGLIVGDIITEVDGKAITGPDSLRSVLASRPDKAVTIVLIRGGVRTELDVTIGHRS